MKTVSFRKGKSVRHVKDVPDMSRARRRTGEKLFPLKDAWVHLHPLWDEGRFWNYAMALRHALGQFGRNVFLTGKVPMTSEAHAKKKNETYSKKKNIFLYTFLFYPTDVD